jgi:hypothetical protein
MRRRCEGVLGRRGGKTSQYGQARAENALPGAPSAAPVVACLAIKAQPPAPRSAQSIDGRTERTCHTEAALGSFLGHPRGSGGRATATHNGGARLARSSCQQPAGFFFVRCSASLNGSEITRRQSRRRAPF